jgi:GT2 family glycosyltransferase
MRDAVSKACGSLRLQTIVVDNASRDDSLGVIEREFADAKVIVNATNVGFGRANNQALDHVSGRYVLLLNTDAFVAEDTLRKTVAFMDSHDDCGIVGVRLVGRDGQPQPACRNFPTPWNVFLLRAGLVRFFPKVRMVDEPLEEGNAPRECDWVPGCYLLIRKSVIDQTALFDPRFFLYCEEVDLCRRVKAAGWKVIYLPDTTVVHLGGESAKSDGALTGSGQQISVLQIESELLYHRKHYGLAGLLAFFMLSGLTDAIHAAKWLLRGGSVRGLRPTRDHAKSSFSLLWRTRFGSRPTR